MSATNEDQVEQAHDRVLFRLPAGSDTAIVAFGHRGASGVSAPYGPILEQLPATSQIVVRDPSSRWYQAGLPGIGETLEEIAERLKWEIAELGATRIVTFGSSMGGYAAILFGCLLDAERAIAIAPQTFLEPHLGHGPPPDTLLRAPDLDPFVRSAAGTKVDLVVAWNNLVDVVHAQHIAEHPSTRILALKSGNHAVLTDLYRNGQAVAILSGYRGETMKGLVQVDPPCDRRDFEAIKAATFAELHRDWRSAIERIEPVAKRYPHWAGPSFHLGRALLNRGEAARGREQLRRALSACPEWLAPSDQLCRALTQLGELTEAEHVLRKAIAVNEWWLSGKLQLAELLAYKDDEEARDVARGAEKGIRAKTRRHPRLPIAQRMLCRALQLQGRLDEAQAAALRAKELRVRLCASSP